jgi:hypothetical protein
MAADCEIYVKPDVVCGVRADGRCAICQKAFCKSHQALTWNGGVWTNKCSECRVQEFAREQQERDEKHKHDFSDWGEAIRLLASSNVPSADVHSLKTTYEKRLFGTRAVTQPVSVGRSWIIGEIPWSYGKDPGDLGIMAFPRLTAICEHVPTGAFHHDGADLRRVEPDTEHGGYLVLHGHVSPSGVSAAAVLVRKLLGQVTDSEAEVLVGKLLG